MRQQKDETSEVFTDMFSGGDEGDSDLVRRAFAGDAFDKPLTCYTMESCFAFLDGGVHIAILIFYS